MGSLLSGASVGDDVIKMQQSRVFVLGDLILDTYVSGKVNRISPEAPVPVVLEQKQWAVLGGAANVAGNIAAFGGTVVLGGRIGNDVDGERFIEICKGLGVDTSALILSRTCATTRKLRVMAGYQQVVRIDSESSDSLTPHEESSLIERFKVFLTGGGHRSLVISDYGKGVCTQSILAATIRLANEAKIPVITDPKSLDMKRYCGSTVIKPNLSEGRELLKIAQPGAHFAQFDAEIAAVCAATLDASGARNVVLSLSDRGVTIRGSDVPVPINFSSTALQVADVSGAGDTMVAFLAMGTAAGIALPRTVHLANIAAGVVCGKLGTATISASEFLESFKHKSEETTPEKILPRNDLANILKQARDSQKTVVFTNGCFDLLHAGHIQILQNAKALGHILVVGLNSDASVQRLKGPNRPLQSEDDRARILAALACVDYLTIFEEETPLEVILKLRPTVLVKGGDYSMDGIVGAKEVQSWGGRVEIVPLVKGLSTTNIVNKSKK